MGPQMTPQQLQKMQNQKQQAVQGKAALNMYQQQRLAQMNTANLRSGGPNFLFILVIMVVAVAAAYLLIRFNMIKVPSQVTDFLETYGLL